MEIWIIESNLPRYSSWGTTFGYWYDEMEAVAWLNELLDAKQNGHNAKFWDMVMTASSGDKIPESMIQNLWTGITLTNVRVTAMKAQSNR